MGLGASLAAVKVWVGFERFVLVTILSTRIMMFVFPLALRVFNSSTNALCLACSALVLSVEI